MKPGEIKNLKESGTKLIHTPDFQAKLRQIMQNLGNPESDTREGCLDILWNLIESNALPPVILLNIGNRMKENLSFRIGERNRDAVFLRSFSALILGLVVSADEICRMTAKANPFLSAEDFKHWFAGARDYFSNEKDNRGYVNKKGWAHATAHGGDLLRDFSFHRYTTGADHIGILELLSRKITAESDETYIYNEDNRLSRIVVTVMLRDELELSDFDNWLTELIRKFDGRYWLQIAENRKKTTAFFNTRSFLHALYFMLEAGMKNLKEIDFFSRTPKLSNEVKHLVLKTVTTLDDGLNYRRQPGLFQCSGKEILN